MKNHLLIFIVYIHSPLTHEKQLVLQAQFIVSVMYRCASFSFVYLCCLDKFRYTNTYYCVITDFSMQYNNVVCRFVT